MRTAKTSTIAMSRISRRRAFGRSDLLAGIVSLLVTGVILADPVLARETTGGPDLAGRWQDDRRGVTVDISSCGAGEWCGVEVRGESCGARVLRLSTPWPVIAPDELAGRLDLPAPQPRYLVRASLREGTLRVFGDDQTPAFLRRTPPPLRLQLVRSGPVRCPADRPTS